jgi:dihydrofolate synthase / folylpolyglutamate synthase
MMNLTAARAWLDEHLNLESGRVHPVGPRLERMQQLVGLLGDPQRSYPVVHVTGTNGKSSTARMTAALLTAHGLSVGLYTSPHLVHLNERIVWDGRPIDDAELAEALSLVAGVEDLLDERPTWFEIMTAAAFTHFANLGVDVAVIEVGLGGRWDATNVVDAAVAVITNVDLDHLEYIGPDRRAVATEKSGIVKPGSVLVLGETDPSLSDIFDAPPRSATVKRGKDFGVLGAQVAHGGWLVDLHGTGGDYHDVFLPLHGHHQAENASIALAAVEQFFGGNRIDDELVAEAFAAVTVPGRLEVVGRQPLIVLDGAHNVHGARALALALAREFPTDERTLVVGLLREKDPREMLDALDLPRAVRLVVCRPPSPRALDPHVAAAVAVEMGMPAASVTAVDDVVEALARARSITPLDGQIIVTGSLYLVGAARALLVP